MNHALPTHRHIKTGGLYRLCGVAKVESDPSKSVAFYTNVKTGEAWSRPLEEFQDATRFEPLNDPAAELPGMKLVQDHADMVTGCMRLIDFAGGQGDQAREEEIRRTVGLIVGRAIVAETLFRHYSDLLRRVELWNHTRVSMPRMFEEFGTKEAWEEFATQLWVDIKSRTEFFVQQEAPNGNQ